MGSSNIPPEEADQKHDNVVSLADLLRSRSSGTVLAENGLLAIPGLREELPELPGDDSEVLALQSTVQTETGGIVLSFAGARDKTLSNAPPAANAVEADQSDEVSVRESRDALLAEDDEIRQFPVLHEFVLGIDPGYENVAIVYCRMRIAMREQLIDKGIWKPSKPDELPSQTYWHEPISVNEVVQRLENKDFEELARNAINTKLSQDEQDLAFDDLFCRVARTILHMEKRFLNFGFDDEFIESLCDELIDNAGQKDKGVHVLIMSKLEKDYKRFLAGQRNDRWKPETIFPHPEKSSEVAVAAAALAEMDAE